VGGAKENVDGCLSCDPAKVERRHIFSALEEGMKQSNGAALERKKQAGRRQNSMPSARSNQNNCANHLKEGDMGKQWWTLVAC
jgi:hypothetical protein